MDRRKFLKVGSTLLTYGLVKSQLNATTLAASKPSGTVTSITEGINEQAILQAHKDIVHQQPREAFSALSPDLFLGKTISSSFKFLMAAIGNGGIAWSVANFLDSLTDYFSRRNIEAINDMMWKHGFTDYSEDTVYGGDGRYHYLVGHEDGFNGCVPFITSNQYGTLEVNAWAEGPVIVGLASMTDKLREQGFTESEICKLTCPRYAPPAMASFENNIERDFWGRTEDGWVAVSYQVLNPAQNLGQATTSVWQKYGWWGRKLIGKDIYNFNWA